MKRKKEKAFQRMENKRNKQRKCRSNKRANTRNQIFKNVNGP